MHALASTFTLALASFLIVTSAQATPFVCKGREIYVGGHTDEGKVDVGLDPVTSSFTLNGQNSVKIIAADTICGMSITNPSCVTSDESTPLTPRKVVTCWSGSAQAPVASASVLMSEVSHNGRIQCNTNSGRKILEIWDCNN